MSSSSRRSSQDPKPESPLSDRSPRQRDRASSKKSAKVRLEPKTPQPLSNSKEVPKHPRRYSSDRSTVSTNFVFEEVHRPTDRVVHVDLEEIESATRGGTPPSYMSTPADRSLLNDSLISGRSEGPRTSTPKKSSRSSRRNAPDSLYKKVLMKSARRPSERPPADSSMDSYATAPESAAVNESLGVSMMSPIRVDAMPDPYRSANSTQRALFSQQGVAPMDRASRSLSRTRRAIAPGAPVLCQLVTPLVVHTSQEVNAISLTGQVLIISTTLVRSAHASSDVHRLTAHLAGKIPLISNEMAQVDIDHDNEQSKHEVFVGSNAILIQRVSTIHNGRDRNSFEMEDRRTYRFVCQGDLLPEDRRDKQTKPRHLTIIAESATVKNSEEIEKSERVMLVFDAAEAPTRVLSPLPAETSLTHANDLAARPSALRDSPVAFEEHVRVSDHSHITIVRKARVHAAARLWDEPLTELKEQRIYTQQLADDADCEPVRITRSHSMTRNPSRGRSPSAPPRRRQLTPSRVERSRTPGRNTINSSVLRPLESPLQPEAPRPRASTQLPPDCTPSARVPTDLITAISPIRDEPARREIRRHFDIDDTVDDSVSLPARTTESDRRSRSPVPKTLAMQRQQSPVRPEISFGPSSPRTLRTSATQTPTSCSPYSTTAQLPEEDRLVRSAMRTPSPAARPARRRLSLTPTHTSVRTARAHSPRTPTRAAEPAVIVDEDTSAGSSQSPTQNRTPTTVSPRRVRLTTTVYQSPAATKTSGPRGRSSSAPPRPRDARMDEWERMLDATQPTSPMAESIARKIPADFMPSDSRLARSAHHPQSAEPRRRVVVARRPLGAAKSCCSFDTGRSGGAARPSPSPHFYPLRRVASEMSMLSPAVAVQPQLQRGGAAPANSAIAIALPFRRQQYVPSPVKTAVASGARAAQPQPRLPRTTAPSSRQLPQPPSSDPIDAAPVGVSASATRQPRVVASAPSAAAAQTRDFAIPHTVVGKPARAGSGNTQKNVELVHNPEDFDEGEILRKRLTLEAKINGHMWNLSVTFALKAERADMIRFAPKRVRIDDQTLWEETENWSQTSLTPVTGPRTVARSSTSYDQVLQPVPVPVAADALPMPQTVVRVSPKTLTTASTASSASGKSKKSVEKKDASKKSSDSKSGDKKKKPLNNTPFV